MGPPVVVAVLAQIPTSTSEAPLNETLTEVAHNPLTPFLVIAFFLVVLAAGTAIRRRNTGRETAVKRVAESSGLRYLESDPTVGQIRLQLFGEELASVHNVLAKPYGDGTEVKVFEFVSIRMVEKVVSDDEMHGFGTVQMRRTERVRQPIGGRRTGAIAKVDAYLPRLTVSSERLSTRILDPMGAVDLKVESDDFNQIFDVRTNDRNFGLAFLDARMIDLILSTEGTVAFETFGHWLFLCMDRVPPEQMPAALNLVTSFKQNIPELILLDYPLPSAVEERAKPPAGFEPSHHGNAWRA